MAKSAVMTGRWQMPRLLMRAVLTGSYDFQAEKTRIPTSDNFY